MSYPAGCDKKPKLKSLPRRFKVLDRVVNQPRKKQHQDNHRYHLDGHRSIACHKLSWLSRKPCFDGSVIVDIFSPEKILENFACALRTHRIYCAFADKKRARNDRALLQVQLNGMVVCTANRHLSTVRSNHALHRLVLIWTDVTLEYFSHSCQQI